MGIVVEFQCSEHPEVECDQTDFTILAADRDDTRDGIIGSIGFHDDRVVWQPMGQDGGGSESILVLEGNVTIIRE